MLLSLTQKYRTTVTLEHLTFSGIGKLVLIIKFYSTLRDISGKKAVEINMPDGTTIQQLATEIVELYPKMRKDLLDENGKTHGHVHIFVDGLDVPFLSNNTSEVISNNSVVDVFHAIGGGHYPTDIVFCWY